MDSAQFLDLVKNRVVSYYNHEMPEQYRKGEITLDDVRTGPSSDPNVVVEVMKTKEGIPFEWHIRHVVTIHFADDHLMFDATYCLVSPYEKKHPEFIFNAEYRLGLMNEHSFFDENGKIIETRQGVR